MAECDPIAYGFKAAVGLGLGVIFWAVVSWCVWMAINREE